MRITRVIIPEPNVPPPTEGPLRPRRRSHFLVRWDAVITCILALLVGVCIGMAVQWQVTVANDPWHGVPWCTQELADNGGICHGDPAMNPAEPERGIDS